MFQPNMLLGPRHGDISYSTKYSALYVFRWRAFDGLCGWVVLGTQSDDD